MSQAQITRFGYMVYSIGPIAAFPVTIAAIREMHLRAGSKVYGAFLRTRLICAPAPISARQLERYHARVRSIGGAA